MGCALPLREQTGYQERSPWLVRFGRGTIEQQAAVAALHHGIAEAHEPHCAIAKVMGFPAALGRAAGAEEGFAPVRPWQGRVQVKAAVRGIDELFATERGITDNPPDERRALH